MTPRTLRRTRRSRRTLRTLRALLAALAALTLTASLTGCGVKQEIATTRDTGLDTLNTAIQQLEQQSSAWRDILEKTKTDLIAAGQSTLANEVSNIAARALSDAGIEARCYTDFLGDRTLTMMRRLRAKITGETVPVTPVFCNPTPNVVDLSLAPERRPAVEIAGYNLSTSVVKAYAVSAAGRVDVSAHLSNPSEFLVTLNTGTNGVPFDATTSKTEFDLAGAPMRSLTVVQPPPIKVPITYQERTLRIEGLYDLNDKEVVGSDENKHGKISGSTRVTAGSTVPYHWEDCVGDEVQAYLDLNASLNRLNGDITVSGTARYYEGDSCGATTSRGSRQINVTIPRGQQINQQVTMQDSNGHVILNFDLFNE